MEDTKTMTQEAWGKIIDDLEKSHSEIEDKKWQIDRLRSSVELLRTENDRLSQKIIDLDRENRQLLEVEARSDETAQQAEIVLLRGLVDTQDKALKSIQKILEEAIGC
jgi:hypothetical protein